MVAPAVQPPTDDPSPDATGMSSVVHRNIRSLMQVRRREQQARSRSEKIADGVTWFAGSMWCVYAHAVLFVGWIFINLGWLRGVRPFDPFPFVMLAMIASVEAIFLSTFILISQNRMQKMAERRAELDLQISLLSEHELTRAITLLDQMARQFQVPRPPEHELEEIKRDVSPTRVAEEIIKAEQSTEVEMNEDKEPSVPPS
jgi:uncharacterized membrane protein